MTQKSLASGSVSTLDTEVVEAVQSLGIARDLAMRAAATLYTRENDRLRETNTSID